MIILKLGLETYGSKNTIKDLLGVSSTTWAGWYLIGYALLRWRGFPGITNVAEMMRRFVPVALFVGLGLSLFEYLTPDNLIYSLTRVNPEMLVIAAHLGACMFCLCQPKSWWLDRLPQLLWLAPLWLMLIYFWTFMLPLDLTVVFTIEDGPVESIQNLILATGALIAWASSLSQRGKARIGWRVLSLAFVFVLMEEISWGQRIFQIETPESLKEINVQDETTLHNIGIFNELQRVGYLSLAAIGIASAAFPKLLPAPYRSTPLVAWYMSAPLVFYAYTFWFAHPVHAEVIEIWFYGGLAVWTLIRSPLGSEILLTDSRS